MPGIAYNSPRSRYYYSLPPPLFHLRKLKHTEVFVSCWASGKHYGSLMFSILIREPLESTLVEGKRMRQDWTEGAIEIQCSLTRNLSPHYEELWRWNGPLELLPILYLYRGPDLYIPATVTRFLVPDFKFIVISTTLIIMSSQKGESRIMDKK